MAFNSAVFVIFATLVILIYYLLPGKCRWVFLFVCSTVFYLSAGLTGLFYLALNITATWLTAFVIGRDIVRQSEYLSGDGAVLSKDERKSFREKRKRFRKRLVALCIVFDVALLAVSKYLSPLVSGFFPSAGGLAAALGISYFTLRSIGYLIDVYREAIPAERNYLKYALFVSYFPAAVQGPITRYGETQSELFSAKRFDGDVLCRGILRMLWGYFKKMIVADRIGIAVAAITETADRRGGYVLILLIFYTVQLYADFTGGIDIALGFSESLGIKLAENFRLPYFSGSLKEYWRRWHISMCSWFRDYVFYPVSTSRIMSKLASAVKTRFGKKAGRRIPLYLSTFTVWLLTGIWHGAGANFIVWGLLNWLVLMVSEELEPIYARFHGRFAFSNTKPYRVFGIARTFALICVLNLFDCFEKIGDTLGALVSIFTGRNAGVLFDGSMMKLGLTAADYAVLGAGVLVMLAVSLVSRKRDVRGLIMSKSAPAIFAVMLVLAVSIIVFGVYGIGYDAGSFIYNRF